MGLIQGYQNNIEVTIVEKTTGTEIVFSCRKPDPSERVGYQNYAVKRTGRNATPSFRIAEAQAVYALKIIKGIREGDFLIPYNEHEGYKNGKLTDADRDGDFFTISSDESSKFYHSKWRDVIFEMASDLLIKLGYMLYEDSAAIKGEDDDTENP